jgi:CysZ protein
MKEGIRYLLKGFRLLMKPGVRLYTIIPLCINLFIFFGFIRLAYHYTNMANQWFTTHLPQWLQWLDWLLWIMFTVCILFFFVYIFTVIANMIAAPFNGLLSEKVEEHLLGHQLKNPLSFKALVALLPQTIARQLQLLFYFLPRACIMLILFFIPGVNLVAGILWFLFSAWMVAIQYLDYPFDNHGLPVKHMTHRMRKNWLPHMEFGIIVSLLSTVPLINLLIMPAAVAGATALWVEKHHEAV